MRFRWKICTLPTVYPVLEDRESTQSDATFSSFVRQLHGAPPPTQNNKLQSSLITTCQKVELSTILWDLEKDVWATGRKQANHLKFEKSNYTSTTSRHHKLIFWGFYIFLLLKLPSFISTKASRSTKFNLDQSENRRVTCSREKLNAHFDVRKAFATTRSPNDDGRATKTW